MFIFLSIVAYTKLLNVLLKQTREFTSNHVDKLFDFLLLSNAEQCADVCMRLRAEYLYHAGRFSDIHFMDVQGNLLKYDGEESRESFEKYLKNVFNVANTSSLNKEMEIRFLSDIQPGDVFVYPAPNRNTYGHAIMVADVAQNPSTGSKTIMLVEGIIPARSIHIMRNLEDTSFSPWFIINEESDVLTFSLFKFKFTDLKCFPLQ